MKASEDFSSPRMGIAGVSRQWRLSPAKLLIQHLGHREHLSLFVGSANDLYSDRKPARRLGHRHCGSWIAEQVVVLAIRHGARIIAFMKRSPTGILMPECRHSTNRGQQDRNSLHFGQKLSAYLVAFNQGGQQAFT